MLQRPEDADLWHTSIRGAAQKAKLLMTEPYPERVVNYLISTLELAQDYYPEHFQIFRVVRRPPLAKGNKSTADDLQKLNASVFYLVIGLNKLHLIPLPDFSDSSARLANPKVQRESYGLITLTSMNVQHSDDRFELSFRAPFAEEKTLILAGASNPDIAICIYQALSFLKSQWTHRTYDINGPKGFLDMVDLYPLDQDEEYGGFDRTLTAYCMAYNCNAFNIVYGVDWGVEDAPEWRLYPPAGGVNYTANEMLAIFRSLRFNEHFCSISFQNINLQSLCGMYDTRGKDHVALRTRSGVPIRDYYNISTDGSLLFQEIQALALSSRRLRRLDFTNALPQQRAKDTFDADEDGSGKARDPGCEIVSALFPICQAELTSVDWVILNGVELGEADLEILGPAMKNRRARFRGFEFSRCGLDDRSLNILLSLVHKQCNSIECLNVSDNPGRLNIENFHDSMARYTKIRKLDLSRTPRSLGDAPLLTEEILLSWHLEELYLNGISFNKATLECISGYLMSDASENLHMLQMEQCNMTGSDLALIMMSMTRTPGEGREMTLSVSNNRLENDINDIVKAIKDNHTPSHLIMRMIEFTKEVHFKRLLQALRTNKTIKMLDISKASLPYDANPETCAALNKLFAENTTLEDLDISGEQSHLEVTRFGIGLNSALTGLTKNHTLKTLRIEYQNLGLEGANTLSSVLEHNKGLEEIYCDHNNISLQGFTIIVNALAGNNHIQFIEEMRHDEQHFIAEMTGNYNEQLKAVSNPSHVRRTLTNLKVGKTPKQEVQWPDTVGVARELERSWQLQVDRLNLFLERNRKLAQGGSQSGDGAVPEDAMRPTTALSQKGMLEHILSNTTPKVELDNPVDNQFKQLTLETVEGPFGEENESFQEETPTKSKRAHDHLLPQISRGKMFEIGDDGDAVFEMER
ncbi:leucine rich repeat protein [Phlyctema vagabunda]|uniref:Leucine rich repeat protein n=1 Tax=Phlyctema vagabunda TaxID=108571 RepID=A0ABR4PR19_9HELO